MDLSPDLVELLGPKFPRVLKVGDNGCTVIAVTSDMILWVHEGKIVQTWRRYR